MHYQYNGHSVGFVSIVNVGVNDAPCCGIKMDGTIMPQPRVYSIKGVQEVASVEVTLEYHFTHRLFQDHIYIHTLVLYGTGDYDSSGRWTQ